MSGTPDQLVLSMGVQTSAASVGAALQQADQAVRRVTGALRRSGVAAADLQTSGLSIQPNYQGSSPTPDRLRRSGVAHRYACATCDGRRPDPARRCGPAATPSRWTASALNLADDSGLLAAARAAAIADAKVKAGQYARAIGQPLGSVVSITDQAPPAPVPVFAPNASAGRPSGADLAGHAAAQRLGHGRLRARLTGWRGRAWPARLARMHANRAAGWWRRR